MKAAGVGPAGRGAGGAWGAIGPTRYSQRVAKVKPTAMKTMPTTRLY
jgi:hypothetical protein